MQPKAGQPILTALTTLKETTRLRRPYQIGLQEMRLPRGPRLLEGKDGDNLMGPAARARLRLTPVLLRRQVCQLHLPLRREPRLLGLVKVVGREEAKAKARDRMKVLGKGLDKEQAKVVPRRPRQLCRLTSRTLQLLHLLQSRPWRKLLYQRTMSKMSATSCEMSG